jgi:2-amino-4-hydroxy-6-hydroxymethyldihydropteridine diphosphokinase
MMGYTSWVTAYVGLGSNLEQPLQQVKDALKELGNLRDSRLQKASSLYRSEPVGPEGQADYINAVAQLSTQLTAESLLDELQSLEKQHGRVRNGVRWGPRPLDLDLLLYGQETIDTSRLKVPHPYMTERGFVLFPLAEIAPEDLQVPGQGSLSGLLKSISEDGIERLA